MRSYAGYIASFCYVELVGVLDAEFHRDSMMIREISHGHEPCWDARELET